MSANIRALFELSAPGYDFLVAQPYWHRQIARVLGYLPPAARRQELRVLDLGCGPGVSTFALAEKLDERAQLTGIDLATNMIERAQRHHQRRYSRFRNIEFEQADATALRFADKSFDLVVGHSFLYLVPDRLAVLREVSRLLDEGGTLVLMEPNRDGSLLRAAFAARGRINELVRHPIDAGKFTTSMVSWRIVSGQHSVGRMWPEQVEELFVEAGLSAVEVHPTLAGLGLHCVGRK